MTKLDPCPLCGNEPDLNVGHQERWVICRSCGVAVAVGATTGDAAINGWNDVTANFTQPVKILRDEFALLVIKSLIQKGGYPFDFLAREGYKVADAMIKERRK